MNYHYPLKVIAVDEYRAHFAQEEPCGDSDCYVVRRIAEDLFIGKIDTTNGIPDPETWETEQFDDLDRLIAHLTFIRDYTRKLWKEEK